MRTFLWDGACYHCKNFHLDKHKLTSTNALEQGNNKSVCGTKNEATLWYLAHTNVSLGIGFLITKSNHKASYVEYILLDKHDIDVTKNVQYIDRRIIVHYFVDIKIRIQEIT